VAKIQAGRGDLDRIAGFAGLTGFFMSEDFTIIGEGSAAAGRSQSSALLAALQARARFLLDLPSDKVVLDPLDRCQLERVLGCGDWDEVWDEEEEMVDEIWQATERETLLRGERWEGGVL
jgi:hypothetical protein